MKLRKNDSNNVELTDSGASKIKQALDRNKISAEKLALSIGSPPSYQSVISKFLRHECRISIEKFKRISRELSIAFAIGDFESPSPNLIEFINIDISPEELIQIGMKDWASGLFFQSFERFTSISDIYKKIGNIEEQIHYLIVCIAVSRPIDNRKSIKDRIIQIEILFNTLDKSAFVWQRIDFLSQFGQLIYDYGLPEVGFSIVERAYTWASSEKTYRNQSSNNRYSINEEYLLLLARRLNYCYSNTIGMKKLQDGIYSQTKEALTNLPIDKDRELVKTAHSIFQRPNAFPAIDIPELCVKCISIANHKNNFEPWTISICEAIEGIRYLTEFQKNHHQYKLRYSSIEHFRSALRILNKTKISNTNPILHNIIPIMEYLGENCDKVRAPKRARVPFDANEISRIVNSVMGY